MGALDELLAKWRDNPDSGTTLALCRSHSGNVPARRTHPRSRVDRRGSGTRTEHGQGCWLSAGCTLDAGLLQEGQAASGRRAGQTRLSETRALAPVPREVLLRMRYAARAEKVLARALQIGVAAADTRMWHDRAVVYARGFQTRVGMRAVADEIDRTVPKRTSIPPPEMMSLEEEQRPAPQRTAPRGRAEPGARCRACLRRRSQCRRSLRRSRGGTPEAHRVERRIPRETVPDRPIRRGRNAEPRRAPRTPGRQRRSRWSRAPVVPAPTPAPRAAPVAPSPVPRAHLRVPAPWSRP